MRTLFACCLLCLPLKNLHLTSSYGYRHHPVTGKYAFHAGVDLRAKHDTVFAIMDGSVNGVGYNDFLGIYIRLDHGDDLQSLYGHLSQIFVAPGEKVEANEPIGITGATGRVTGEHLHFSILYRHQYIDPMEFLYQTLNNKNHE
jgi:murein DD-endopeptidase MepM/ murein hydrolase activator NlpD